MPIVRPDARVDSRLDPRLRRAATIAQDRANARSKSRCWRYVKEALVASGVIDSYPKTNYASQAGEVWCGIMGSHGCRSAINFGADRRGARFWPWHESHVVIRTKTGFASDYWTKNRCKYPLVAVYGKFSS